MVTFHRGAVLLLPFVVPKPGRSRAQLADNGKANEKLKRHQTRLRVFLVMKGAGGCNARGMGRLAYLFLFKRGLHTCICNLRRMI